MDTLARIRLLTGDDPFWNTQNPLLLKGEVGFRNVEGDDPLMRVGDGVRRWMDLPDMNKMGLTGPVGPIGPQGEQGDQGIQGPQGTPGDQEAPWRTPYFVSDAADKVFMGLGWEGGPAPNYGPQPAANRNGFCGPYAWWIDTEGDMAGILQMHHFWPGTSGTFASSSPGFPVVRNAYFSVDGANGPVFEVLPDGSGRLGAHNNDMYSYYSTVMTWASDDGQLGNSGFEFIGSETGKYGLPGGGTLNVWGLMSCHYRTAVTMGYPFYISNDSPNVMPGQYAVNGLRIGAGFDRSDRNLRCVSTDGNTLLEIRGDGAIFCSPSRVTSGPFAVWYLSDGQLAVQSSSARYKTNIRTAARERAREIVSRLRLVNFTSLCADEDPGHVNYGLIAEEVAAVEPALVGYDGEGRAEGVNYQGITLLLLPLVQELLGMTEPTGESYG